MAVYFLWHCLYPNFSCEKPEPHPLDGVVLYVVRTFLISKGKRKRILQSRDRAVCNLVLLNAE